MNNTDRAQICVEVVKGSPRFAAACRVAAATLAMTAVAQAAIASNAPLQTRAPVADTPAAHSLRSLLTNQMKNAELVSPEQMKVLRYGVYPPVKTALQKNGKLETHWTLHPFDLVHLAREAAARASALEGIKIDPAKVGAVMIAESSMVSRIGWSANGKTPSFGLGQLEARTALALGVKDPSDPRESAFAVARLLAEGTKFARANSQVDPNLAMSLAYNTSTRLRKSLISTYGAGLRMEHLPQATQSHVKNMAYGEQRMKAFAKLCDQHEKAATPASRYASTIQPQKAAMNTAHRPAPSTHMLMTSLVSDSSNQARLRYNQQQLEQAGHVQALPMTSKGLVDMRQAVDNFKQRLGQSDNVQDLHSPAGSLPSGMLGSPIIRDLHLLAMALVAKAKIGAEALKQELRAAANAPSSRSAYMTAGLLGLRNSTSQTMQAARDSMQAMRLMAQQDDQFERPA
jgi:hypothetical protein